MEHASQIIIMKIACDYLNLYQKKDLKNPAAIVDANHSNSNKKYKEQLRIVSEVLHSTKI